MLVSVKNQRQGFWLDEESQPEEQAEIALEFRGSCYENDFLCLPGEASPCQNDARQESHSVYGEEPLKLKEPLPRFESSLQVHTTTKDVARSDTCWEGDDRSASSALFVSNTLAPDKALSLGGAISSRCAKLDMAGAGRHEKDEDRLCFLAGEMDASAMAGLFLTAATQEEDFLTMPSQRLPKGVLPTSYPRKGWMWAMGGTLFLLCGVAVYAFF